MIIQPVPVILPAFPFHQFMVSGNTGNFREEKSTQFEYFSLSSKENSSAGAAWFWLVAFPRKLVKHHIKKQDPGLAIKLTAALESPLGYFLSHLV